MDMRRDHALVVILFTMTFMLPAAVVAATLTGYQFALHWDFLVAGIATAIYVVLSVILLRSEVKQYPKVVVFLIACLPTLAEINLLFYMWESGSIAVTVLSAVWIVCSIALVFRLSKSTALKVTSTVVSMLLLLPIALTALTYFTIGQIGRDTVVNTVASPKGTHRAEVIASSQGALGGNTVIRVYHEHDHMNLFICEFQKVQCVYIGEWDKHYDMDIYWKSEQELAINGNICEIE